MKKYVFLVFLLTLFLYLQHRIWIGDGSLEEVWQLKKRIQQQQTEIEQLKERNNALRAEVQDLQKGKASVEERARSELGMVKEDETFYQVIEQ